MSRNYVNNAYNRKLGRSGMPLGSAVSRSNDYISSPSRSKISNSSRTYVDNAYNRNLGRVGVPLGTTVVSKSSFPASPSNSSRTYIDNAYNTKLGRVVTEKDSVILSKPSSSRSCPDENKKVYVANPYNRCLGRAGLPFSNASHSHSATNEYSRSKVYADNHLNRNMCRVGMPIEQIHYCSLANEKSERMRLIIPFLNLSITENTLYKIRNEISKLRENRKADQEYSAAFDQAEGVINRHELSLIQINSDLKHPKFQSGEIIKFSELELGDKLGGGGFGDVHVAIWKNKYQVAVKKLRVQRVHKEKKLQFEKECKLFSSLSHPAIIDFYGACIDTPNLAIVMEFMSKGSLFDCLHIECTQFSDVQKNQMIVDALSALSYIHKQKIAHRDIKSRNILVCDDMNHCKLADFGLALKDENDTSASVVDYSIVGTFRYSAPEVLEGERLTIDQFMSADIYSMTLTFIELLTETEPFGDLNQHQLRKAVLAGERPSIDCPGVPACLRMLLAKCMSKSPGDRPRADCFLKDFENSIAKKTPEEPNSR